MNNPWCSQGNAKHHVINPEGVEHSASLNRHFSSSSIQFQKSNVFILQSGSLWSEGLLRRKSARRTPLEESDKIR